MKKSYYSKSYKYKNHTFTIYLTEQVPPHIYAMMIRDEKDKIDRMIQGEIKSHENKETENAEIGLDMFFDEINK